MLNRLRQKLAQRWLRRWTPGGFAADGWEYKVVQMVAQTPADPTDASKRLGGALSPESLRNQFPEHYGGINGRQQISDFLNRLGDENWELVQVQQIAELPLMIFKRPKQLPNPCAGAKPGATAPQPHAEETPD